MSRNPLSELITEVDPVLEWMDTGPIQRPLGICVAKISIPVQKIKKNITNECDLKIVERNPCDSRSTNQIFLFQSCYGVGCPVAVTSVSGVKKRTRSVYKKMVLLACVCKCVCVCAHACVCVRNIINYLSQGTF
jgi:hypothetical protein